MIHELSRRASVSVRVSCRQDNIVRAAVRLPGNHATKQSHPNTAAKRAVRENSGGRMMSSTLCSALVVAACLMSTWWVVQVMSAQQVMKLKTRDWDGAPVCAQDEPSRRATISAKMSNAPAAVGCSMTCSADYQCQHFNYVQTDSLHPCHLYYYRPTDFEVQPNCQHYQSSGKSLTYTNIALVQ